MGPRAQVPPPGMGPRQQGPPVMAPRQQGPSGMTLRPTLGVRSQGVRQYGPTPTPTIATQMGTRPPRVAPPPHQTNIPIRPTGGHGEEIPTPQSDAEAPPTNFWNLNQRALMKGSQIPSVCKLFFVLI